MKIGDKFVMKEDAETVVFVSNIFTPDAKARDKRIKIAYTFEGQDKAHTMVQDFFLEMYRPWGKLDKYLTEIETNEAQTKV
jgi:outer membrane receptor for Fe3+-dicitrate